jgi:hypothetical protein
MRGNGSWMVPGSRLKPRTPPNCTVPPMLSTFATDMLLGKIVNRNKPTLAHICSQASVRKNVVIAALLPRLGPMAGECAGAKEPAYISVLYGGTKYIDGS